MRRVLSCLALLSLSAMPCFGAEQPSPQVAFKCTGVDERQVRDLVADEKGRLKKGDFLPVEKIPETFEHIFKPTIFRIVVKDRSSVTSTEICEVVGAEFQCTTKHGLGPMPYVIVFNLDTGAYAASSSDELVKSNRRGTCDMGPAKALWEQAKANPAPKP
ncbi:MAG: hypothetical protein ACYCZX_19670 [Rhodospirillaceae bacterium]